MGTEANLQTIMQRFLAHYAQQHAMSAQQWRVCQAIERCRTRALGGEHLHCDQCEFEQDRYHSCRNRHCPQCQFRATETWSEKQQDALLPVPYFHVVFTLPHEINDWVKSSPETVYRLLFESVWLTLKRFGADRKRLAGQLGMTGVLHTWGQTMVQHVHLHCLVPGGALAAEGAQWNPVRSPYLFPDRALARHFRGVMVIALRHAYEAGELLEPNGAKALTGRLNTLMEKKWVVYSRAQLQHSETIINYLARYTYRIAISNSRLLRVDESEVTFRWKDYTDGRHKIMTVAGDEFLRRFLLHVLPNGFMRVRHFGFLANRCRRDKLAQIRTCLARPKAPATSAEAPAETDTGLLPGADEPSICPRCHAGHLQRSLIHPAKSPPGRSICH